MYDKTCVMENHNFGFVLFCMADVLKMREAMYPANVMVKILIYTYYSEKCYYGNFTTVLRTAYRLIWYCVQV